MASGHRMEEVVVKKILLDLVVAVFVCSLALALSIFGSVRVCDASWFERTGSVVCLAGALLTMHRLLRLGPRRMTRRERIIGIQVTQSLSQAVP